MIEGQLYSIDTSRWLFNVIAKDFAEAEKIALEVIKEKGESINIYEIKRNGNVYYPKTKTITIEI